MQWEFASAGSIFWRKIGRAKRAERKPLPLRAAARAAGATASVGRRTADSTLGRRSRCSAVPPRSACKRRRNCWKSAQISRTGDGSGTVADAMCATTGGVHSRRRRRGADRNWRAASSSAHRHRAAGPRAPTSGGWQRAPGPTLSSDPGQQHLTATEARPGWSSTTRALIRDALGQPIHSSLHS